MGKKVKGEVDANEVAWLLDKQAEDHLRQLQQSKDLILAQIRLAELTVAAKELDIKCTEASERIVAAVAALKQVFPSITLEQISKNLLIRSEVLEGRDGNNVD